MPHPQSKSSSPLASPRLISPAKKSSKPFNVPPPPALRTTRDKVIIQVIPTSDAAPLLHPRQIANKPIRPTNHQPNHPDRNPKEQPIHCQPAPDRPQRKRCGIRWPHHRHRCLVLTIQRQHRPTPRVDRRLRRFRLHLRVLNARPGRQNRFCLHQRHGGRRRISASVVPTARLRVARPLRLPVVTNETHRINLVPSRNGDLLSMSVRRRRRVLPFWGTVRAGRRVHV